MVFLDLHVIINNNMNLDNEFNFPSRSLNFDVHVPTKFSIEFVNNNKSQKVQLNTPTDASFGLFLREYWVKLQPNLANTNNPTWYLKFDSQINEITDNTNMKTGHPLYVEDHQIGTTYNQYDRPVFIGKTANQSFQSFDVDLVMSTDGPNTHDVVEQAMFIFELVELATPEHDNGFRESNYYNRPAYGRTIGKAHLDPRRVIDYPKVPQIIQPYTRPPTN